MSQFRIVIKTVRGTVVSRNVAPHRSISKELNKSVSTNLMGVNNENEPLTGTSPFNWLFERSLDSQIRQDIVSVYAKCIIKINQASKFAGMENSNIEVNSQDLQ